MSHAASRQCTNVSNKKTLDIQHTNKLNEFYESQEKIQTLRDDLQKVSNSIQELERKKRQDNLSKEETDLLIRCIDERDYLRRTIEHIENQDDELDYLVNTGSILFKYYDIVEKGMTEDPTSTPKITGNSILKYFVKKNEEVKEPVKTEEVQQDRASLLDAYLSYTDDNHVRNLQTEFSSKCENCGSTNRNLMLNDGIIYCNECSCVEYIIVDYDRPSYKDPPREISYFAYKRINHFNESRKYRLNIMYAKFLFKFASNCFAYTNTIKVFKYMIY